MRSAHNLKPNYSISNPDGIYHDCSKCQLEIQPSEEWDWDIDEKLEMDWDSARMCNYFHLECPDWPNHIDHTQTCIQCLKSLGFDHTNWDFSLEIDDEGKEKIIYFHQTCLPF